MRKKRGLVKSAHPFGACMHPSCGVGRRNLIKCIAKQDCECGLGGYRSKSFGYIVSLVGLAGRLTGKTLAGSCKGIGPGAETGMGLVWPVRSIGQGIGQIGPLSVTSRF